MKASQSSKDESEGTSMARPNKQKRVCSMPKGLHFCSTTLTTQGPSVLLEIEEYETIRLIDYLGFNQEECAQQMNISRATAQSLYAEARKKIARFLVEDIHLYISGGNFALCDDVSIRNAQSGISDGQERKEGNHFMKIAVTYENGEVFQHFGQTTKFKIYDVNDNAITASKIIDTQGYGHGALVGFLKNEGVTVLICGGLGGGARNMLTESGMKFLSGASGIADEQVASYLAGNLVTSSANECHHHDGEGQGHCHGGEGHGSCEGGGHGHSM